MKFFVALIALGVLVSAGVALAAKPAPATPPACQANSVWNGTECVPIVEPVEGF